MIIFSEPKTAPIVGLILAVIFFVIQLLLCFKAKKTIIKRIPLYMILLFSAFVLLICMGLFGEGSGFLGNIHLMVAAILAIVGGVTALGILAAWIVYKLYTRKK